MNGPLILTEHMVYPSISSYKLETKCKFPEISCVITKKTSYMDDETWIFFLKLVAPGIRTMEGGIFLVCCLCYFWYI